MSMPEQLGSESREGRATQYLAELAARVAQLDPAARDAQVQAEVTALINGAKAASNGDKPATDSEVSK